MIPISGLDQIRIMWLVFENDKFVLFGSLLYTDSDRVLVDYMRDGLIELDVLSGDECAVFVIESPSKEWINYAQNSNHIWWRSFKKEFIDKRTKEEGGFHHSRLSLLEKNIIENNSNCIIIVGDDNGVSLQQLIEPSIKLIYNRAEAIKVARHFGLNARDLPCLIFFKNFNDRIMWKRPLEEFATQGAVKKFFREFFDSDDFTSLLDQARGEIAI